METVRGGLYITDGGTNWRDANGKLLGPVKRNRKGEVVPFDPKSVVAPEPEPEPEESGGVLDSEDEGEG